MAEIFSFRGVSYSNERFGKDITDLITQPYDKITDEMKAQYYARHPKNFVRIVLGKKYPNDDEYFNYYTRAAGYLQCWLSDGTLVAHRQPAIYAYHQVFNVDGREIVRRGFVALAKLEAPGKGVKAHEKTLAGPKADRLNLMRHIRAQVGHIFMLYSDPTHTADDALEKAINGREPDFIAKDWFQNEHRIWAVTDEQTINTVRGALLEKTLFIADGHHRYETAVNYWQECQKKGLKPEPNATETFENRMMTFVNLDDPGLIILPTHRVVHSVQDFNVQRFIEQVEQNFAVEVFPIACEGCIRGKFNEAMAKMEAMGEQGKHSFVFVPRDAKAYYLLTLKDETIMNKAITEPVSDEWKKLDVSILHKLILENLLGIDSKALEEKRNLYYIRDKEAGFEYFEKNPAVQCEIGRAHV